VAGGAPGLTWAPHAASVASLLSAASVRAKDPRDSLGTVVAYDALRHTRQPLTCITLALR
jgi:hypothetical protein